MKAKMKLCFSFLKLLENRTCDNLSVWSSDLQCKMICPATVKKLRQDQTSVYFRELCKYIIKFISLFK